MRNLTMMIIKSIGIFVLTIFLVDTLSSFFPAKIATPVVIEQRTSEELPGMCDTIPFMESADVYAGRSETAEDCEYNSLGLPKERYWLTSREWRGAHLKTMKASRVFFHSPRASWCSLCEQH